MNTRSQTRFVLQTQLLDPDRNTTLLNLSKKVIPSRFGYFKGRKHLSEVLKGLTCATGSVGVIDLSYCVFGDPDVAELFEFFSRFEVLKRVNLSNNCLHNDQSIRLLEELTRRCTVDITGNLFLNQHPEAFSSMSLRCLGKLTWLKHEWVNNGLWERIFEDAPDRETRCAVVRLAHSKV